MAARIAGEGRFSFEVQWTDAHSGVVKTFNLCYFEENDTVEMFDVKSRKTFLKRCQPTEPVMLEHFAVGNTVTIMSRPLAVVRYLDTPTAERFKVTTTTTLCLVKPDVYNRAGTIISMVHAAGMQVSRAKLLQLSTEEAEVLLAPRRKHRAFAQAYAQHVELLTADAVLALEVRGNDSVSSMHLLAGPADPADASTVAPRSIRALLGTDAVMNAVHVSASTKDAEQELAFVFNPSRTQPCVHDNCTAVIIKPHAVQGGHFGPLLQCFLDSDLEVAGVRSLALNRTDAGDYLAPYKGVVPEYSAWLTEVTSGLAVALQIRGSDIVTRVRELVGPYDPAIATALRPDTLRAHYGVDAVHNALHCTDLPEDGPLECQFLFETVQA